MAEKKVTTLKIQYVRSTIGRPKKHKKIVRSLGLRKLNQVVEHQDNSAMRGAVAKVPHLVRIVDGE
jgi:large subunit ribosomal protein L30